MNQKRKKSALFHSTDFENKVWPAHPDLIFFRYGKKHILEVFFYLFTYCTGRYSTVRYSFFSKKKIKFKKKQKQKQK